MPSLKRDHWSHDTLLTTSFILGVFTSLGQKNLSVQNQTHLVFCPLMVVLGEKKEKKKLNKLNFLTVWHVISIRFQDCEHVLI